MSLITLMGIFLVFLIWYYGVPKKITEVEAEHLRLELKKAMRNEDEPDNDDVLMFTRLMKSDDGKPFVMVNLIKYRQEALASANTAPDESMKQYMKIMLPNLFKRACHPAFVSKTMGPFIYDEQSIYWDEVTGVRYRSRRDMIKMVIALSTDRHERLERGEDYPDSKDEAVEQTQVFPVKMQLALHYVPLLVFLGLSAIYSIIR